MRTDNLTGLLNKYGGQEVLESSVALHTRYGQPVCVALVDIDHFDRISERLGAEGADTTIAEVGQLLAASLRPYDTAARWGDKEFLIILPRTSAGQARGVMERIRGKFAQATFASGETVTISAGIAQIVLGEPLDHLIDRADKAVHQAQQSGRDRIVILGD